LAVPIYEYGCATCHRRRSLYFATFSAVEPNPACPECKNRGMTRLISSVALLRGEESRLESLADPSSFGDLDEEDPRSVARWARRMRQEMGDELGPEFDEMADQIEADGFDDEEGAPAAAADSDPYWGP
jgi:putative FmdB family regulatory protein